MKIKLSIIMPCYNAEPYIHELLDCIDKQITDEVEVILIDDGSQIPLKTKSYSWLKSYRHSNKGTSKTRNRGLELAKGELIWFVDADDLISGNAISYILSRADEKWDYMDLSWKSLEDNKYVYKLHNDFMRLPNPSACTRVFRRSFIGDTRFPEQKDAAEDEYFTRHLGLQQAKHVSATDFIYFYRTETPDSMAKQLMHGQSKTKRIGYFFHTVTEDMRYLVDEIKKEDEQNEVFLLTFRNDIPELAKYCQIWTPPRPLRVAEARGEQNKFLNVAPQPYHTQVVVWTSQTYEIGGIETFIYSFCKQMSKYYDITVVYDNIGMNQLGRLLDICPCIKNNLEMPIHCDTLIVNRIGDKIPQNFHYGKTIQMAHCIKQDATYHIPQDRDYIVNVSQASKDSFGDEAKDSVVIHNLTDGEKIKKALLLVSALRVGAPDKRGNDERCIQFAQKLNKLEIPFMWLYFGDKPMARAVNNMHYCGSKTDIRPYIAKADYLIQLSGSEAFSYSLLEALELKTPVIVTPLEQNKDMNIIHGENAYVFDFDTSKWTDEQIKQIVHIPQFKYKHDNEQIIQQWRKLLGDSKPKRNYKPKKSVQVLVVKEYRDMQREELMKPGTRCEMKYARALDLQGCGFVRIL